MKYEYKMRVVFIDEEQRAAFDDELEELLANYGMIFDIDPKLVCLTCERHAREGVGPSHEGSARCQSGSIASGGTKAHCTCDVCF